jgi:hypothetical protein
MARLNGVSLQGVFGGRTIRVSPSNKWRSGGGGGGGGDGATQAAGGAR